jgi:predicted esterase
MAHGRPAPREQPVSGDASDIQVLLVPATVHGRVLVRPGPMGRRRWLVGFHGYGHNARIFIDTLRHIPGAEEWTIASVQGLHPFYHPRTNEVLANWMTREDREHAIADNVAYVDAVIAQLAAERGEPEALVFAGFSQGVAMAYRAALLGAREPYALLAVGGDVPPELRDTPHSRRLTIVMCAGREDTYYGPERLEQDAAALRAGGAEVRTVAFQGGHEWSAEVNRAAGELLAEMR